RASVRSGDGGHTVEVPARARLEERKGRDSAAVADAGQPTSSLSFVARVRDHEPPDDRAEEGPRHRDSPHLAEHDRELEHAEPGTAVRFGEDHPRPAELRETLPRRIGGA